MWLSVVVVLVFGVVAAVVIVAVVFGGCGATSVGGVCILNDLLFSFTPSVAAVAAAVAVVLVAFAVAASVASVLL